MKKSEMAKVIADQQETIGKLVQPATESVAEFEQLALLAESTPIGCPLGVLDEASAAPPATRLGQVPVESIAVSKENPRTLFDQAELEELAASIKQHGVLQPLLVRQVFGTNGEPDATFLLVAGERRLRAAKMAGLVKVPCQILVKWADYPDILKEVEREFFHLWNGIGSSTGSRSGTGHRPARRSANRCCLVMAKEPCNRCDLTKVKEKADPNRPGWLRGTCAACGKFLGYRTVPLEPDASMPLEQKPKRSRRKQAAGA